MADPRLKSVGDLETRHLLDIVVDLDPRLNFGAGPVGQRVLFRAAKGSFEGPRLRGEVLQGGGDWALFRAAGAMTLDVRLSLRTHDGELIYMTYGGRWVTPQALRAVLAVFVRRSLVVPAGFFFCSNPLFETGSQTYAWLNDIVCVGKGYLVEGAVAYKIFEVL